MTVSQRKPTPCSRSRYSIIAPARISIGDWTTENPSRGGVIASRFRASAKNGKTSEGAAARRCSRTRTCALRRVTAAPSLPCGTFGTKRIERALPTDGRAEKGTTTYVRCRDAGLRRDLRKRDLLRDRQDG